MTTRTTLAAAAALALALAAPLAQALEAQTTPPAAAAIDEATLTAFVNALRAVDAIEQSHMEAFHAAETDAERARIAARANEEMIEAIEALPEITVEDYVAVLQQAQADPELGARIRAMLEG